ncbi:Muniscin C-terminal mu homology domain-containing protein [Lipomyces oligophaga]|uniref:Muniscin C-terminal mu homology domain-containing protein n=1 Tax=Lipomyces oligophaga TaxID=45792 RepID=UPI0034CD0F0E
MNIIKNSFDSLANDTESAFNQHGGSKKLFGSRNADQSADTAAEWNSRAPLVLEKLQSLDEARLIMLKDLLTRYQTSEVDKAQRTVSLCEKNLNELLSFEPQDEIKMFAVQIQTNGSISNAQPSFPPRTRSSAPPPPPAHGHHLPAAAMSPASAIASSSPASVASKSSKKRFSLAPSSNTSADQPHHSSRSRMSLFSKSEGGRRKLFGGKKDKSRNKYNEQVDLESTASGGNAETDSIASSRSQASSRPEFPARTTSGAISVKALPSPTERPQSQLTSPTSPTGNGVHDDADSINVIGTGNYSGNIDSSADSTVLSSASNTTTVPSPVRVQTSSSGDRPLATAPAVDDEGYSVPPPVAQSSEIAQLDEAFESTQQDQSPFNVDIQSQAIQEDQNDAQAAMNHVATSLRAKPTISGRSMRGRRSEIYKQYSVSPLPQLQNPQSASVSSTNSHGVPPPPPPPHKGVADGVLAFPTTTENREAVIISSSQSYSPHITPDTTVETSAAVTEPVPEPTKEVESFPNSTAESVSPRDEEDINSGLIEPATGASGMPGAFIDEPAVHTFEPLEEVSETEEEPYPDSRELGNQTTQITEPSTVSEPATETLVSGQPRVSTPVAEPVNEVPPIAIAPDLSGSIVETVNVSITGGEPARVYVVGDVALSYRGDESVLSGREPLPIRLSGQSLKHLDRIQANGALVSTIEGSSEEGEYLLQPSGLSAAPMIAFKYSMSESSEVPVIVEPVWKFEPHQTSVIVRYWLNEAYGVDELAMSEFSLVIGIEGAVATQCQSRPPGVFNAEAGQLAIVLTSVDQPEVVLKKGTVETALVRFWTDGQAREAANGRGTAISFRFSPAREHAGIQIEVKEDIKEETSEEDPFADEPAGEGWTDVDAMRSVVSGSYFASATDSV